MKESRIQKLGVYAIKTFRKEDFLKKVEKENFITEGRFYYFEDCHNHYHRLSYAYPKLKQRIDEVKELIGRTVFKGLACFMIVVTNKVATVSFVCASGEPRVQNRERAFSQVLQQLIKECESVSVSLQ